MVRGTILERGEIRNTNTGSPKYSKTRRLLLPIHWSCQTKHLGMTLRFLTNHGRIDKAGKRAGRRKYVDTKISQAIRYKVFIASVYFTETTLIFKR